jgi:hypothetical protein
MKKEDNITKRSLFVLLVSKITKCDLRDLAELEVPNWNLK